MPNITRSAKIVVTRGPYKGKVGTVVRVHSSDFEVEDCYEVILDTPAHIRVAVDGKQLEFEDHRIVLVSNDSIKLLNTSMGKAIYEERIEDVD